MAQKIETRFVDDIDGTEAEGEVTFGLDGWQYQIDLNETNAKELRSFLGKFIDAGRRLPRKAVTAGKTTASAAPSKPSGYRPLVEREQTQAVREWCNANGHPVSDRGRIPKAAQAAFDAAH